jgi:hypothetical protein
MSTRATLAVDIETKRIRIAYALIQPNRITAAGVWLHCSKVSKQNQSGFSIRSNLYNGPSRNAVIISSASIDKSTFIREMIIISTNQTWQNLAQNVWKRHFGDPLQSVQSLKRSISSANAIPHTNNTATRNDTSMTNPAVPDILSTFHFDAESRKDMFMSDEEIEAAFHAQDRPVSALVIGRMANLIKS